MIAQEPHNGNVGSLVP